MDMAQLKAQRDSLKEAIVWAVEEHEPVFVIHAMAESLARLEKQIAKADRGSK